MNGKRTRRTTSIAPFRTPFGRTIAGLSVTSLALASLTAASLLSSTTAARAQWYIGYEAQPQGEAGRPAAAKRRQKVKAAGRLSSKSSSKSSSRTEKQDNIFPAGQMQLVVSIARQRVAVFSDGKQVAEAPVSTGMAGHPTPMGIFSVISKARHHSSNIYSGAPMPFMHRITWSGIALHEGVLPGYPASHGCIRMPGHFVSKLFAASKIGTRVVITREPVAPVEFSSARLPVPKKEVAPPLAAIDALPDAQRVIEAAIAQENRRPVDVKSRAGGVQVASAGSDTVGTVIAPAATPALATTPAAEAPKREASKRSGPVQIFVSRKESKMYVRQGFAPLFDAPVKIAAPDEPWGTHIFTVMTMTDGKAAKDGQNNKDNQDNKDSLSARWTVLTIPSGFAAKDAKLDERRDRKGRKLSSKEIERIEKRARDLANAPEAAVALERFEMAPDAVERIAPLLAAGSSLIVSDNGLSEETGRETDFIVATH